MQLCTYWVILTTTTYAYSHFVSIYYYLRGEGMQFPEEDESDPQARKTSQAPVSTNPDAVSSQQEADDIAKGLCV